MKISTVHKQHYNFPLLSWVKQISAGFALPDRALYLSRLRTGLTADSLMPFCSRNIHYSLSPLSTQASNTLLYVHYTVLLNNYI